MRNASRAAGLFLLALLFSASTASAATTVTLSYNRTDPFYEEQPAGAPLPFGQREWDRGDILDSTGHVIGHYLRVKDFRDGGFQGVTWTLYFTMSGSPTPVAEITLQGVHASASQEEVGGVSGSSITGLSGVSYRVFAGPDSGPLVLTFP
jgi:hypothetical protein